MILIKQNCNLSFNRVFKVDNVNHIIKRSLMATGSVLTNAETIAAKELIHFIAGKLRKGPLNQQDLIELAKFSTKNTKIFQHIMTTMFPTAQFPLNLIARLYPNIRISSPKEFLNWYDFISAYNANLLKQNRFFLKGNLQVLVAPEYNPEKPQTYLNKLALLNTGQPNPDYHYEPFGNMWTRYYDLKAGKFSIMSGHIYICSNVKVYEEKSLELLKAQRHSFKLMGEDFIDIVFYLDSILNNNKLNIFEKNEKIQMYYSSIMHRLPSKYTPSLIFNHDIILEKVDKEYDKKLYGITNKSLLNKDTSQESLANALIDGGNTAIIENYKQSYGISTEIKLKLLTEILQLS